MEQQKFKVKIKYGEYLGGIKLQAKTTKRRTAKRLASFLRKKLNKNIVCKCF